MDNHICRCILQFIISWKAYFMVCLLLPQNFLKNCFVIIYFHEFWNTFGVSSSCWLYKISINLLFGQWQVVKPDFACLFVHVQWIRVMSYLSAQICLLPQVRELQQLLRPIHYGLLKLDFKYVKLWYPCWNS